MTRRTPNRCAAVRHEQAECEPPKVTLQRMRKLETEISEDLTEREEMLG